MQDLGPNYNSSPNDSDTHGFEYKWSIEFSYLLATINIIVACCIVFGNIMVLLVILRHRGMRTRTNLFLVNLAVADLFVGVFAMPFSITTLLKHEWVFGDTVCLFNGWMNSFCLITSIHTLMYISIHKYFSIARPLSNPLTLRYIVIMMAAAWFWAAVCSTMNITGLKVMYKPGTSQCGPNYPNDPLTYFIHVIIQITDLIIPFIILIFCYTRIFQEIRKLSKRLRAHSSAEDQDIIAQEKGVAVTMLIVLATFVIMSLPYLAYANYTTIRRDKKHFSGYLNPVAYTFLYMSSMCNPIIYAFRSAAFREGYKEILCQQANYVTDEEANNKQRTSRLMSIIAILRRGSVPANQNVIHKNGDIIITRGDRIVCVRKASSSRHPEDNVAPIPERLHGIQEDNQEEDKDGGSDDDNNVFHLLKANTERESLSDVSPRARGGSRYTRVNGANSCKSEKERSRSSASFMADSPKASKDRKGIAHDANLASAKSLEDSVVLDSDLRENIKLLDGQQNRNGSSQGIIEVGTTSAKKKTTSKQSDSIETSREQSGVNTNLRRFISRSSEELPRPPTLVRLPSLEFLDPPISIFRPRSNTGSHEKLSMSKIKKNKEHSSEKQNAPPRKKRQFFDSASDVM